MLTDTLQVTFFIAPCLMLLFTHHTKPCYPCSHNNRLGKTFFTRSLHLTSSSVAALCTNKKVSVLVYNSHFQLVKARSDMVETPRSKANIPVLIKKGEACCVVVK